MQPDSPYQLLETVGSCEVGKVWSAVDAQGQMLTVAVLDAAFATDQRWRDAFASAANSLYSQDDEPSLRYADLSASEPWVACAVGDWPGAEQIFAALGMDYRPNAAQSQVSPADSGEPVSGTPSPLPAAPQAPTAAPLPPTMDGPRPVHFSYHPNYPPLTPTAPPRRRTGIWVGVAVVVVVALVAGGGIFASRSRGGAPVASVSSGASGGSAARGTPTEWAMPPSDNRPSELNTGVPKGTKLRVVEGNRTFGGNKEIYSGLDLRGNVRITGDNITLRRSIIRGVGKTKGDQCTSTPVVWVDGGSNVTIEDVEVYGGQPNACLDGIWAKNATLTRVNIHHVVDGVKAYDNVLIHDSYIHDLTRFASDPAQDGGPTHNDGVQSWEGNRHITIRRNTIMLSPSHNAAYQVNQTRGLRATDIHIESNWLDGGWCTLNFSPGGGPTPMTGIFVVNNRFGRTSPCPIFLSAGAALSANDGNVWDDTGEPIPPPRLHWR